MMKNEATLRFKNFAACPRSFWIRLRLTRAGAAICCACLTEVICPERSNADAKSSGVGKNLKNLNFKSRNATSTNFEAGRYIDFSADYNADRDMRLNIDRDIIFNAYCDINFSADHSINSNADRDINFGIDRAANFKISNANLKADLARPKAGFR